MINQITTKTKIIIVILSVLLIGGVVAVIFNNKVKENKSNNNQDAISNMMDYFENINENDNYNDNEISNSIEENNVLSENIINEQDVPKIEEQNSNNTAIVGKEEQESKQENIEVQNRQKAIELAKEEWAISVDSYDFNAELQDDGTYNVSVINKANRTVITIYNVNVNTGKVTE